MGKIAIEKSEKNMQKFSVEARALEINRCFSADTFSVSPPQSFQLNIRIIEIIVPTLAFSTFS